MGYSSLSIYTGSQVCWLATTSILLASCTPHQLCQDYKFVTQNEDHVLVWKKPLEVSISSGEFPEFQIIKVSIVFLLKGHDWYTFRARVLAFLFEPYGSLHSSRNT